MREELEVAGEYFRLSCSNLRCSDNGIILRYFLFACIVASMHMKLEFLSFSKSANVFERHFKSSLESDCL